jgi:thymidylate synthase
MLTPIFDIHSTDFSNAWAQAVQNCLKGPEITFGDAKNPKIAKDTIQTISLTGNAIFQVESGEIHPLYPFKQIKEYCKEFTPEFLEAYTKKPESEKFSYLYYERLKQYAELNDLVEGGTWDQLWVMQGQLADQIRNKVSSNRTQAITWYVHDQESEASPCLRSIWLRHIGNNEVDVHFSWRSRDCFGAWQSNLIALVNMLYDEVLDPNSCLIKRIVDFNDSLHIYNYDWPAAAKVTANPFLEGR